MPEELPEKWKKKYAEATALFVQKTGVRVEDAQAFVAIVAKITNDCLTETWEKEK